MSHDVLCRPADDLASLLDRCGRGDEEAFTRLYDATAPRAYGVALRVVRNQKLAEDVTQEAYLELWRESRRYDSARRSAMGLLLTIVHRRAVDRLRSARPRPGGRRRTSGGSRRPRSSTPTSATGSRVDVSPPAALVRNASRRDNGRIVLPGEAGL